MDFKQAENRFKQLKAQFEAGQISEPEFKAQLDELMIQDEQGNWWMIGYETELWYRHDGKSWVQTDLPGITAQKPAPLPSSLKTGNRRVENIARVPVQYQGAEKTADSKKTSLPNWVEANRAFLLSWKGRTLLGGLLGLILGSIPGFYGIETVLIYLAACGLAGLITYPHKSSIVSIVLGFFIGSYTIGAVFGILAGALFSRILYWLKVIK